MQFGSSIRVFLSGISDPPALLLGRVVMDLIYNKRPVQIVCSIMVNGDTGRADIMVGNRLMWSDHWNADVSIGNSLVTIRNSDDGCGTMTIPIDWNLNFTKVNTAESELACAATCADLRIKQDDKAQLDWDSVHYRDLIEYNVPVPKQRAEVPRAMLS
jgi:hypothetical protein